MGGMISNAVGGASTINGLTGGPALSKHLGWLGMLPSAGKFVGDVITGESRPNVSNCVLRVLCGQVRW